MTPKVSVSLIICTFNRSASLRKTLEAVASLDVPAEWWVEVVVVDNASTDDTAQVVRDAKFERMEVRYMHEARKGKCHALNRGLAESHGDYLLFTDDDVLPGKSWLRVMVEPMRSGQCDAVNGQLVLAPHLLKPWQTSMHKMWLAASLDAESRDWSRELIGANMGIRRAVLKQVPGYDPELGPGPGAVGFCEDTFFGWQLFEAGFRIQYVSSAVALHQLDASRLQRRFWLNDAARRGRTQAYLRYHWKHDDIPFPRLAWFGYTLKLLVRRAFVHLPALEEEGCPEWEMSYVMNRAMCEQFIHERSRQRNYSRRGLVKNAFAQSSALAKAPLSQGANGPHPIN